MTVSPFTPIFFLGDRKADGIECDYVQTFSPTDRILLEVICAFSENKPDARLVDAETGKTIFQLVFNSWYINDTTRLDFLSITLNPGYYRIEITGIGSSEVFRITADELELEKTTLIQYSMKNNRQRRDVVFFINGMQHFFDFRVHGGFKDNGWSFSVESEQFVTPLADIAQLYGLESTQKIFTLGGSAGVPIWFGEMLNRILVCTHVYFDGEKYSRKDAGVPEVTQQLEGVNSFIFKQSLQKSNYIDPVIETRNRLLLRRVTGNSYRITIPGTYRKI